MQENLLELSNNLKLSFGGIDVFSASQIDFHSSANYFSENINILKNVKFKILRERQIVFDSSLDFYGNLNYKLAVEICDVLRNFLCLSPPEILFFENLCKDYLKNPQGSKMPVEMLIAQNIYNKTTFMSVAELSNMEIKQYERIQIALRVLNGQNN